MKMNAYKDFHIFACLPVIKTCVTGLVLKDLQIALMSL